MRALDLSDVEAAAAHCGELLMRWCSEVIKVERPGRDAPVEAPRRYLSGGKRRVALDYRGPGDRALIGWLAPQCDVLVTDAQAADAE